MSYMPKFQVASENEIRFRASDPLLELANVIETEAQRQAYLKGRVADLSVEVETSPDIYIVYEDALKVVSELIDNAFKFSNEGQAVYVTAKTVDNCYELMVKDCGIGMKPEHISEIGAFMQFERSTREQQGLGLGLAIVEAVAASYDYEFEVTSQPDSGTVAYFRFKTR